jgi:ferrochelatase
LARESIDTGLLPDPCADWSPVPAAAIVIDVLEGLGRHGAPAVLVVPVAFTSDHVETLFEIDIEYRRAEGREGRAGRTRPATPAPPPPRRHLASKAGIRRFERAPSLNGEPLLGAALGDIVAAHLRGGRAAETPQFGLPCAGCANPACRRILKPVGPYSKGPAGGLSGEWPSDADAAALRARGAEPCE